MDGRRAGIGFHVGDCYGLGDYAFRAGALVEDARSRWYFCVQVAVELQAAHPGDAVGVALGLKDIAVTSAGAGSSTAAGTDRHRTR